VLWSHQLLNCRRHFDMKWSSWFTLFFRQVQTRLLINQGKTSSHITSQNRLWDYPTAWWNHWSPWKNYRITSLLSTTLKKLVKLQVFFSEVTSSQMLQWFRHQDAQHTATSVRKWPLKKKLVILRVFLGWCSTNSWFDNFFKGINGSIMQLDNPIIYFVRLYDY
jgi:hypothetical protein